MENEIKISNPQTLKKVINRINSEVENNKLEVLFERGILENGWLDIIDCCYYDYEQKKFKELICETYHGSGGWFRTLEFEKSELNEIFRKDWEYILYNYKSKIILLSTLKGGVGSYEVNYPLNKEEVKYYFEDGQQAIEEINRKIQRNDKTVSNRYVKIN